MTYYMKRTIKVLKDEGILELLKRTVGKVGKLLSRVPDQNRLYEQWIEEVEKPFLEKKYKKASYQNLRQTPKISILMPVYNISPNLLNTAIQSIRSQWYDNWELCLYDDASTNKETIQYLSKLSDKKDGRVILKLGATNKNISLATNECFDMSTGDYVLLMDNDDVLRPNCLYEVVKLINKKGPQDLIYYDEDKLSQDNRRIEPFFKPSFSPELLYSMMYPTHAVFSRKIFKKVGKMRPGYEGSQDYDLVLRVAEVSKRISHIPWILYSWRKVPGSTADNISGKSYALGAAKNAIKSALKRRGLRAKVQNDAYPFHTVVLPQKQSKVEIIILTKNGKELLETCINSINRYTKWEKTSITIINHDSEDRNAIQYLDEIQNHTRFHASVYPYKGAYNFSKMNNFAVSKTDADYVLFLNNDTEVITKDWIEKMLGWAEQKDIGSVGVQLLYGNRYIQHAGIILGVGGVANHAFYKMPGNTEFYYNHLNCIRNYLALTAACLMIGRSKFEEVGGFNEDLPESYNDIDLGLKLFEAGYRNVYLPYVKLIHYESQSRDPQVKRHEDEYMYGKWRKYIDTDPYYNPNLTTELKDKPVFSL